MLNILESISILCLTAIFMIDKARNDSHWKATEHEFTSIWTHINTLEYSGSMDDIEDFMIKEGLKVDE